MLGIWWRSLTPIGAIAGLLTGGGLAGLAVVIGTLVYEGLFSERRPGGYVPTHMENGRLVPGGFR